MRKTSHDGGDSTSITSGHENDIMKRPGGLIMKTKKTSLKRKVQNLSESDDGVVEPLLPKERARADSINQSAKFILSKTKTESTTSEKGDDKDKLLDNQAGATSMTSVPGITDNQIHVSGIKDMQINKGYANSAPNHNHMNTNVFKANEEVKSVAAPKTHILVEIDGNKTYNPSPLIFTTAKIHTDGKTKPMEPIQVNPVPILSTIEGNVVKVETGIDKLKFTSETAKKNISNCNNVVSHSEVPFKDTISTIPENKNPNTVCKIVEKTPMPNVTGKITKVTSSTDYVKSITQLKSAVSSPISLPQTTYSIISESVRTTAADRNLKSVPGTSAIASHSSNIPKPEHISDTLVSNCQSKVNNIGQRDVEVDINKNIGTVVNSDLQKPETSKATKNIVNTKDDDVSNKSKIYRNTSSSLSNKQLQRQKTTVEDVKDSDNSSKQYVTKKDSTDTTNKTTSQEKMQAKVPETDNTNNKKIDVIPPKSSVNSKITVQSSIPTKSAISTSKLPSTVIKSVGIDVNTTSTAGKTSFTPSVKQTPLVATTGSVSKPNTTKTTIANSNPVKTLSTTGTKLTSGIATTSSPKNTTSSIPKSVAAGQSQLTSSTKPLIVAAVKSTPNTSVTKASTSVTASNTPSALSKTSTVTTMKASISKAPSANKVAQSKSTPGTTTTTKTASNTQSDPKTSDKSKDDKSKA